MRPVQTRFRFGSAPEVLNLAEYGKSPDHYAKGTPSPLTGLPRLDGLRSLVGTWFQVHYPPLVGVLPIVRSRYWFAIGRQGVLSLGRWASQIRAGFHVSGPTQVPSGRVSAVTYRTVTVYGRTFQNTSVSRNLGNSNARSYNPPETSPRGLG
jgi:hypothetical protein